MKPLDDAKYIRLDRRISTSALGMTLDDVRMVIETGSGTLEVGIGDDGSLDFPMDEALLAENPPVRVNVPEGQLAINVEIEWEIPVTQTFGYALVTDVEDEYRRFVKAQGMLARMMAPDLAGLAVRFPDGERATATVSAPAGVVIEAGEDGRIVIPAGRIGMTRKSCCRGCRRGWSPYSRTRGCPGTLLLEQTHDLLDDAVEDRILVFIPARDRH